MIKILHISDLHFYKDAQTYNMQAILIKEAGEAVRNIPRGHKLLVVTGDFHSFNDKNYEMADSFLSKLIGAMDIDPTNDVFVIPGNHDVGNDEALKACGVDPDDARAYTNMLKNGNKKYVEKKLSAYTPYCIFARHKGFYPISTDLKLPACVHVRQWQGVLKLNILHLNTTLSADGTPDKSNQTVDITKASDPATWEEYIQSDIPAIALGHNHFYDLKETDQLSLKTTFSLNNVSAYLCGDTHRVENDTRNQMIVLSPGPKQGRLEIPNLICAKSIGDLEDDYSDFGYYWHNWDENTGDVKVIFRRWKPEYGARTVHDATADGFYRMRPFQLDPEPETQKNGPDSTAHPDPLREYLDNCLMDVRKNHPSFRLMDKDDIDYRLLPGIKEQQLSEALAKESDKGSVSPVWKLIQSYWNTPNKRNIIIQGKGGIGKTVTLLSITSSANAVLHAPAVYIPLHNLVTKEGKCLEISTFLKQKYPEYYDKIGKLAAGSWENGPKILLLLDGFNEVPVLQRSEILRNIKDWDNAHPGVQMIAVSRPTTGISLQELSGDPVKITLEPLKPEIVRSYLKDCGVTIPKTSSSIWKVLTYPLFLTLYVKTGRLINLKSDGYNLAPKQAESGGALIWNFLQRELLRINSEDWVIRCAFACEYIIPFIAYHMVKKQHFTVSRQEAMEYIDEAVKDLDTALLPRHLNKLYQAYQDRHFKAPNLNDIHWYETVLQDTGILVSGGDTGTFAFMHQNFRDCLAGLHLVNQMEMAEKSANYPPIWQGSHHPDLIKYASELMEKETFKNFWEKNRLMHPTHHTGTINLLETRKYRDDWGELDFSGMNLCDLSLERYMRNDQHDLCLFRKPELTINTQINRATFQSEGHKDNVNCIAATPDGLCISGSSDASLRVWDPHSGECLHVLEGHKSAINCVVVTSDGLCVSGSYDHTLRVWDPHTGESLHVLEGHKEVINCIAIISDELCVSGSKDNTLRIWDFHSGKCLHVLEGHRDDITCVAITPDGLCISGSDDNTLRVWNPYTGECMYHLKGHKKAIECVAVTPDGLCVSGSMDHTLRVWNPHNGECLYISQEQMFSVDNTVITHDGLCISSVWRTLYVWDPHTGELLHVLEGHEADIKSVVVTSDGLCISGSWDNTVRVWDPYTGECLHIMEGHKESVEGIAVIPGGLCVSGSIDYTIRVWSLYTGECLHIMEGQKLNVTSAALTPEGLCIIKAKNNTLCVWDLHTGECLHVLEGHTEDIMTFATTLDGLCISGSDDNTLRVWNPHTGKCLHVLKGHTRVIFVVKTTTDGLCVSGSMDNTLRVWDPHTGKCLHILEGHTDAIMDIAISQDGLCVSGSIDSTLRVWDLHTGKCLHTLKGHSSGIVNVTAISNGLCVSRALMEDTVRIWDVHTGECVQIYEGQNLMMVTSDGLFVNRLDDNLLDVWDIHNGKCKHVLKGHRDRATSFTVVSDRLYISGAKDKTLRIWDSHSGKCLNILEGSKSSIIFAEVTFDGLCVSGSIDNIVRIWDLNTGKCLHILETMNLNVQGMNLSKAKLDMELREILPKNGVVI